eukprot:CAMPEP_0172483828 /NCGR_PEP_ID=MMETSP1066-20121228/11009_1 /TAXON_ID=671091 /ORGANISM="Coscinodiscus wailesii, Strain CCMP2513" /LENGTH=422 /DNA_ID=CAMNT_0013247959 /DNA_START=24 /DNA_END=1292 /DNA_ORIENTATION=-
MTKADNIMSAKREKEPTKRQKKTPKFKKAPQAPKRFKSAFMFFSSEKHPEIRKQLEEGESKDVPNVAKLVSQAWRNLSPEERAVWDKLAADDKRRYEVEKSMYTGPWKVPACKRAKKDPDAPKRPMSAFLAYAKANRSQGKAENPHLSNTELTKHLAEKWKLVSAEERSIYVEKEEEERGTYKKNIAEWRTNQENKLKAQRKEREQIALSVIASGTVIPDGSISSRMAPNGQHYPPSGYGYMPPEHDVRGPQMHGHYPHGMSYNTPGYNQPNQYGNPGNHWNNSDQEMPPYAAYDYGTGGNDQKYPPGNTNYNHPGDRQEYSGVNQAYASNYHHQQQMQGQPQGGPPPSSNGCWYSNSNEMHSRNDSFQMSVPYPASAGQGYGIGNGDNCEHPNYNQSGYYPSNVAAGYQEEQYNGNGHEYS